MIEITNKQDCCGCSACAQVCPKRCISMKEDGEGFLYPEADAGLCVECGLCGKVCPVINQGSAREPLEVFAARNNDDEVRRQSSSGGVFTLLAGKVLDEGGVVFGASFDDNWEVVHTYADSKEGLSAFRGSKYVQSRMGDNFRKAEDFLKEGRKVLFSGTPCQIAGLKLYLRKEYSNLLTVDFICHGVPSPGVWREYLREETSRLREGKNPALPKQSGGRDVRVAGISFRDKTLGWKKYCLAFTLAACGAGNPEKKVLLSGPLDKNLFLRGFRANLYLRPSCHACPSKCMKSGSDITIADFWGIEKVLPEMDDDKGTSVVFVNSRAISLAGFGGSLELAEIKFEDAVWNNQCVSRSVKEPEKRSRFFAMEGTPVMERIRILTKVSCMVQAKRGIKKIARKVLRK